MSKETIHEFQQTLLALWGQIHQIGNDFYERLLVASFQSSGLVKKGGFHSPQTYQDVLNILRSAIVAAKAKGNLGWLVLFIAEHFWSVMDDMGNEKGLGDALRQLVGPKFTFEDSVWGNKGQKIKHNIIRIANQSRAKLSSSMHSVERKFGYMLHKKEGRQSTFKSNAYEGFGPGLSYTFPLRLGDISRNPRVVCQCQRAAVTVSKRILPPSMANNEPSPEAFMQWLQKDRMESHITPLVEDAIKNNVPVSELIRHLSLTYSQMSGIIGCPISAHAPRQPEGNQMSAIPDHNTGANKVSPICERPSAGGNVCIGQFDDLFGDTLQDVYDSDTFWDEQCTSINAITGTHGRGNGPTPDTCQTPAKVCFP